MKKKRFLSLAGIGLSASLLLSIDACPSKKEQPKAPSAFGGVNALVGVVNQVFEDWTIDAVSFGARYLIVDGNGNILPLSRNDAGESWLDTVLQCRGGSAILDDGLNLYFFDPKKKAIIQISNNSSGLSVLSIFNNQLVPVGYFDLSGLSFTVIFCNGDYFVTNEVNASNGRAFSVGNVVIALSNKKVFVILFPTSLQNQMYWESPTGISQSVSVGDIVNNNFIVNPFGIPASSKYTVIPEIDQNNDLTALAIVDNNTGSVNRVPISPAFSFGGTAPDFVWVQDVGNDTYIAIGDSGTVNTDIYFAKYNGTSLSPIGASPLNIPNQLIGLGLDGNGNLYAIDNNGGVYTLYSRTADGSTDANVAFTGTPSNAYRVSTQTWIWSPSHMLPLTDGILMRNTGGSNFLYKAGETTITDLTAAGGTPDTIATSCAVLLDLSNRTVFNAASSKLTCYDRNVGAGEVAFLPSADTTTWSTLNPDGVDTNGRMGLTSSVGVWNDYIYTRDPNYWYMCPIGGTSCQKLNNVTPFETGVFSVFPQFVNTPRWMRVDIVNDEVKTFNYFNNFVATPTFNWNLTALVTGYSEGGSLCDSENAGWGATILVADRVGASSYSELKVFEDPTLEPNTVTPPDVNYECVEWINSVWVNNE